MSGLYGGAPPITGPVDISGLTTLIAAYDANSSSNTIVTPSLSFNPSDVDTANSWLNLSTFPFGDSSEGGGGRFGTVTYTTTGTPIGGLTAGGIYCVETIAGKTHFYEIEKPSNYANVLGGYPGDLAHPFQSPAQNRNRVTLTSQGTGVHTITSAPRIKTFADLTGNGFDLGSTTTTAYNECYEQYSHPTQGKFIKSYGPTNAATGYSVVNQYGPFSSMIGATPVRDSFRDKLVGNRFLSSTYSIVPKNFPKARQTKQFKIANTDINAGTGVITVGGFGHLLSQNTATDSDAVRFKTVSGNTLPTPTTGSISDKFYTRKISATQFTLHSTIADAWNNTNIITFSSAGSGSFMVVGVTRIQQQQNAFYAFDMSKPNVNSSHTGNLTFTPFAGYAIRTKGSALNTGINGRWSGQELVRGLASTFWWAPAEVVMPTTTDKSLPVNSLDQVVSVTKANPCVITCGGPPGVATGESFISFDNEGMTELNDKIFDNITVSGNTITLNGVDSSSWGTLTNGGKITPVYYTHQSLSNPIYYFIHRTKAQAIAQSVVADASVGANCVQFNGYPTYPSMGTFDEFNVVYADSYSIRCGHNCLIPNAAAKIDELTVITIKYDGNPGSGTNVLCGAKINGQTIITARDPFEAITGNFGATVSGGTSPIILGNAGEPHVPGTWEQSFIGVMTAGPAAEATLDAEIVTLENRLKARHGIA